RAPRPRAPLRGRARRGRLRRRRRRRALRRPSPQAHARPRPCPRVGTRPSGRAARSLPAPRCAVCAAPGERRTRGRCGMSDLIGPELVAVLRRLKLSLILPTLPDRLALARQHKLPYQDLLLGHLACARGATVLAIRTDRLLKTLRHARLDHTVEAEMRRLIAVDLLVLDDFGLDAMDPTESRDVYELFLERHRAGSIIVTSNR